MADVIIDRLKLGAIESSDVRRRQFYHNKWNADRETPRSRPTYSGLCSPLPALDPAIRRDSVHAEKGLRKIEDAVRQQGRGGGRQRCRDVGKFQRQPVSV